MTTRRRQARSQKTLQCPIMEVTLTQTLRTITAPHKVTMVVQAIPAGNMQAPGNMTTINKATINKALTVMVTNGAAMDRLTSRFLLVISSNLIFCI